MATDNKGVMVYLPKEVEEYITEFCTEYNITRKDKEGNILPSLGTGIVTYLKSKMSGESPDDVIARPSKSLGNGLTKDEVLDLIREYCTSDTPSNGLTREEVLDLIGASIIPTGETLEQLKGEIAALERTINDVVDKPSTQTKSTSEALDLSTATEASWGAFHQALGLEPINGKKSTELGAIATTSATEIGFEGWKYNSNRQRFFRQ